MKLAALRSWRHWPKVGALAAIVLLTGLTDSLTHVPTAAPIIDDRSWEVPVGNELWLTGAMPGQLLALQPGAGDGVALEAGPVRLADGRTAASISWQVSTPGKSVGDNKVLVQLAIPPSAPNGTVVLQRAGDEVPPEFLVGSPDTPLEVAAGVTIGDELVLPPIHVRIDGKPVDDPGLALGFTLQPGGSLALTVPAKPDGSLSGLLVRIGERERTGNRLRLREAAIRSEGVARPWKSACSAPPGKTDWGWVRGSGPPSGKACAPPDRAGTMPLLAASALTIDEKTIRIDLVGSAYVVDTRKPANARWLDWAKGNLFLAAVMSILIGTLAGWLIKTLLGRVSAA